MEILYLDFDSFKRPDTGTKTLNADNIRAERQQERQTEIIWLAELSAQKNLTGREWDTEITWLAGIQV